MKYIFCIFIFLTCQLIGQVSLVAAQDTTIYDHTEVAAEPIGGMINYLNWLDKTIQIPDATNYVKANGEALLEFVVEPNGELSHIQVSSKLGAATDVAIRKAVARSARWRSAMINGRPVRARYQMQIRLNPASSSAEAIVVSDSAVGTAEPPGGLAAFMQWIGRNYQYPQEAVDHNVSGRLKLRFIVEKDGSITHVKVLNDLGYGTGEEAVRVLKQSPRWKPGTVNGKQVRVSFELPLTLSLQ